MAEIEPIEIINNNPEIIEIIDRRKIKKNKKVEEDTPPVEKIDKRKILRALWRTTILEDGTIKYNKNHATRFIIKHIMMRNVKL